MLRLSFLAFAKATGSARRDERRFATISLFFAIVVREVDERGESIDSGSDSDSDSIREVETFRDEVACGDAESER